VQSDTDSVKRFRLRLDCDIRLTERAKQRPTMLRHCKIKIDGNSARHA